MQVGELFLNLGVKGSEKTVAAITSARKSMSELGSMSLEAKAGLIGAFYAFEQLMAASGRVGTNLTNFEALTGISANSLQQWQYAARQAGVSADEMAGSIKGVQNSMTNMLLGKGAPEGLGLVSQMVGFDPGKARDTLYVMQQLQKFAQAAPADVGNSVLKSFGLSEGTIAAMRRNAFRPELLNRAPTYSESQIRALDRANIAWANLGNKIEMAFGKFNAAHGGQLVADISKLTDQIIKLSEAFIRLAEAVKVFKIIGKIFEGWSESFSSIAATVETFKGLLDPKTEKKSKGDINDFLGAVPGALKLFASDYFSGKTGESIINQTMNFFHDGKDHQKIGDSVKRATQGALRQIPAQAGGY